MTIEEENKEGEEEEDEVKMQGHGDDQRRNQEQIRYNGKKLLVRSLFLYSPFMLQFSIHIIYLLISPLSFLSLF